MEIFQLNNPHFYISIAIAILNGILLCFVGGKLFQILQLSGYKLKGYREWIADTKIKFVSRISMLSFLSLIAVLVTNALLNGFDGYTLYLGFIFYIYFCVIFIINISKIPQKTPLKQTRRMNRLIVTTFTISAMISFILIAICTEFLPFLRYGIIVITPVLLIFIVPLAHIINVPMENLIRKKYIKKAKQKLSQMPDLIKIGITGSYGKTTTKHILNVMLSKKYSVCMTPHSFNTPMGLTKVVLKYLKYNNQILIAEMGARNVGDIKYLCDLIHPKHAIITAVGSQHLATFGSEENIAKTKNELVQSITDGYVVFNSNNQGAVKLYQDCNAEKFLAGINDDNAFCNITDVQVSSQGSTFKLNIDNQQVQCTTKLLGLHNLQDIAIAATMAYKVGVSIDLIAQAICELKPMSHRLEVIKNKRYTIIDNSYNSSIESSKSALDVLNLFTGGKKVIITPGIVEMGDKEYQANVDFGKDIAKVCDKVIIVNEVNKVAILDGLKQSNFDEKNIFTAENLSLATNMLSELTDVGDVVLFENDLPDNYT